MLVVDPAFWRGRRVFVTGHTGFKGGWLSFWLKQLGASVAGYSLPPPTQPALFDLLQLDDADSRLADIRDGDGLSEALTAHRPEVVIHLAAQSLVRPSYDDPIATFETNIVGTAAVLQAVRACPETRAVVLATSDKCYENREWERGYVETDALGGHDPYSASKGAAEIVIASMRRSYFSDSAADRHPARVASVRAGNVIGGGDWSPDRLVPDIVRGCLGPDETVTLRYPQAVRPWQHVLEPVSAYLALAERLHAGEDGLDAAFNFGPPPEDTCAVIELAEALVGRLGRGRIVVDPKTAGGRHEAGLLRLDCGKAHEVLGWRPRLALRESLDWTADWYAAYASGADMRAVTAAQIEAFGRKAEGTE